MRSWSTDARDIRHDPVITAELADWLRSQGIKDTVSYDRIIGCPHEEGIDYPIGRTCPRWRTNTMRSVVAPSAKVDAGVHQLL